MGINDDIKGVLQEVGTAYTVTKFDGTMITGGFFDPTVHTEHTNQQIRSFFSDFTLPHDTPAEVGDILTFSGKDLMVLAMHPETFENEIVDYLASGYFTNSIASIKFYVQDDGWDANYDKNRAWNDRYTGVKGVIFDRMFRSDVQEIGNASIEFEKDRLQVMISDKYQVEMGDRWWISDDEYYKVEQKEPYVVMGAQIIYLTEDTRE